MTASGEPQVLNFRVKGSWFIVDGVYPELVLSSGQKSDRISITRSDR